MKVFYHRAPSGNVGDDLNAVLWQRLVPDLQQLATAEWLIGVGTILDRRIDALPGRKIVMGSGLRPDTADHYRFTGEVRFAAVRGVLTAQRLGLGNAVTLGDPGFLVAQCWQPRKVIFNRIGFIPHIYSEQWSSMAAAAADAGLHVISPTLPLDDFLEQLHGCARVYCESLHGAIFADALRVPWARVRICSHLYEGEGVAEFKWRDAFSVFDLPVTAVNRAAILPMKRSWPLLRRGLRPLQAITEQRLAHLLIRRRDDASLFQLSNEARLQERIAGFLACVQQLRSPDHVRRWRTAQELPSSRAQRRSHAVRVLAFPKYGENPFLQMFSDKLQAAGAIVDDFNFRRGFLGRYDVLHLHWPDSHLLTRSWWRALGKHARLAALLLVLRARGTRIVWMMHNLTPHEKNHWLSSRLFALWFPRLCTRVIALSGNGLATAHSLYPALQDKPAAIVPHGHYHETYPMPLPRNACRTRLGLTADCLALLFFGNIRRYKNVPSLIEAFRRIPDTNLRLVIAGSPALGVRADELAASSANDARVQLHLKFIPDDEVPLFLGAADLVVLPFDSILNSGSVLLALSLNRPVLAPRLGALPEIENKVGSHWLRLYDGELTPQVLMHACARESLPGEWESPDLSAFDWQAIAAHTLAFYQSQTGGAPAGSPSQDSPSGLQEV